MTVTYQIMDGARKKKIRSPYLLFQLKKKKATCSIEVFTLVSFKFITFWQNME